MRLITTRSRRPSNKRRRRTRTFSEAQPLAAKIGRAIGGPPPSPAASPSVHREAVSGTSRSRLLSATVLLVAVGLLVWFFQDLGFYVYEVQVVGTSLVGADDVRRAASVDEFSIFYVNRRQVEQRISEQVVGVAGVHVDCQLPARLRIQVQERDVRFVWQTGGVGFLVDAGGQVIKADTGSRPALTVIRDLDNKPLRSGDRVDETALRAAEELDRLLQGAVAFEYSADKGLGWVNSDGVRVWFGDDQLLDRKVACIQAVLQKEGAAGKQVQFIDVRFLDSPYYQ